MWSRRIKETFAITTIGDGLIELLAPKEHSRLWEFGPERVCDVARFFADNPILMRLLGAAQVALGLWLAFRQYRE